MPDLSPTDTTDGTWGGVDLEAVRTLIAHQRRDIGSCLCGWGVGTGDLGRLHSLHVWRELQRAVLPLHDARVREQVAEEIAQAIEPHAGSERVAPAGHRAYTHAAAIARAHRTTPTEEPDDA